MRQHVQWLVWDDDTMLIILYMNFTGLPVVYRIRYKLCVVMLWGESPNYINDILNPNAPNPGRRNLRFTDFVYDVPRCGTFRQEVPLSRRPSGLE